MPDHRATFTISQTWDSVTSFVRVNYFGEYFATHADDTCAIGCWNEIADSAITVDAEVSYFLNDSITLSAGANNLFDQEAKSYLKNLTVYLVLNITKVARLITTAVSTT